MTPLASSPAATAFISYARENSAFAHELDAALTVRGIRVLIDRSAIAPTEEFEKQLDAMILEADVVVFLMSPASLASRYCQWEVARAGLSHCPLSCGHFQQTPACTLVALTVSAATSEITVGIWHQS